MKLVRIILPYFLLAVFIMPSAGIMVHMHHCLSSGSVSVYLEDKSDCCMNKQSHHCCQINEQIADNEAVLEAKCCDNSEYYLKLAEHLVSERMSLANYMPAIVTSYVNDFTASELLNSLYTLSGFYSGSPPNTDSYIDFLSLRL